VGATDADELRAHGWDDAAIHDAIQVIAYFNYINRVAEGVGIGPEPEWVDEGGSHARLHDQASE
jgi:alkylhydroperoxidase family enzyme